METPFSLAQPSAPKPLESNTSARSKGDSTISNDLTIIGDVSTSGSVTLDGIIEGNIYCTSLTVTKNGRVKGGVVANQEVTVHGTVTGSIRGRRVRLQSTAKVEGDIFHQGIGIEMGTRYDGTLRWTEDEHVFNEHQGPAAGESKKTDPHESPVSAWKAPEPPAAKTAP